MVDGVMIDGTVINVNHVLNRKYSPNEEPECDTASQDITLTHNKNSASSPGKKQKYQRSAHFSNGFADGSPVYKTFCFVRSNRRFSPLDYQSSRLSPARFQSSYATQSWSRPAPSGSS